MCYCGTTLFARIFESLFAIGTMRILLWIVLRIVASLFIQLFYDRDCDIWF